MKVLFERSNASPEGLIVSSVELHVLSLERLRLPKLTKLLPEGLSVSLGGKKIKNTA